MIFLKMSWLTILLGILCHSLPIIFLFLFLCFILFKTELDLKWKRFIEFQYDFLSNSIVEMILLKCISQNEGEQIHKIVKVIEVKFNCYWIYFYSIKKFCIFTKILNYLQFFSIFVIFEDTCLYYAFYVIYLCYFSKLWSQTNANVYNSKYL